MSRRIPCPSRLLRYAFLATFLLASGIMLTPRASAEVGDDGGFVIQDRRPQIDPEYGVPGDDDQPTVTGRRKKDGRITSAPSEPATGQEPKIDRAESRGIAQWGAILRTSVLRLGMMLR